MFIESFQAHLAICAQPDLPSWGKMDPDFWNVISIRESVRPRIDVQRFRKVHHEIFDDVLGLDGLKEDHGHHIPSSLHLKRIFDFVDSIYGEPILVHCWAGVSRSTAVGLGLIVRAMHFDGFDHDEIVAQGVEQLLMIRPKASPNPLVLKLALEQFLDPESSEEMTLRLLHHPVLFANRFPGASPPD